jgi:ABC-type glycerol-3-phosphate transport system substrate-binding protein
MAVGSTAASGLSAVAAAGGVTTVCAAVPAANASRTTESVSGFENLIGKITIKYIELIDFIDKVAMQL